MNAAETIDLSRDLPFEHDLWCDTESEAAELRSGDSAVSVCSARTRAMIAATLLAVLMLALIGSIPWI